MNRKRWWVTWVLLAALCMSAAPMLSGCLDPDQRAAMTESMETSAELDLLLAGLSAKIIAVRDAVKQGKTPVAEGQVLVKELFAKRAELLSIKHKIGASIKALQDAGTPWYGYIPGALSVVIAIAGSVLGRGKIGNVLTAFGGLSRGLEDVLIGMNHTDAKKAKTTLRSRIGSGEAYHTVKRLHAEALENKI